MQKVILKSSEVGAKISIRDCETRLGVSEMETKKLRVLRACLVKGGSEEVRN